MVDLSLKSILLSAPLIIKNFVDGEKDCNYEKYLLEFINKSNFFLRKSNGEYYIMPINESNGECDCNSTIYQLDFKLIASESSLEARSLLSDGKIVLGDGAITITTACKSNNLKSIETTRLFAALRMFTFEALCNLKDKELIDTVEKDVASFLRTLETKKNVLLFFPYEFFYDKEYEFDVGVEGIRKLLSNDFECSMKYRKYIAKDFDTYMSFIYQDYFVFLQEKENKLAFVDKVRLDDSPIYIKLSKYSQIF